MKPQLTKVFHAIAKASLTNRIILSQGGTGSSKTYSHLQLLIILVKDAKRPVIASIMSETFPHLRRGVMRDFFQILEEWNMNSPAAWNRSEYVYRMGRSIIEFFSADQPGKLKGSRRDYLYINELNNIPVEVWDQAEPRTRLKIFGDFNPDREFYAHTELADRPDCVILKSTYKDNPYLSKNEIQAIEARRKNEMWWRVYGEGELGIIEGLIFNNWQQCNDEEFPDADVFYGLDWGFTNSETALVAIARVGEKIYLKEIIYETGLLNRQIDNKLRANNITGLIVGDSESPKDIHDLKSMGHNIIPAYKYKGCVNKNIEMMHDYQFMVTKSSLNIIKEFRNWQWIYDNKTRRFINEPFDAFNHALKAVGYAMERKIRSRRVITVHN